MPQWIGQIQQRYRYPHSILSVLLVLGVLVWIENISVYFTCILTGLVILYPLHGSAMLVLGALLSVVIGLENAGSKPFFYGPDIIPSFFFLLLAVVVLRWKIQWERDASTHSVDRHWKNLVGLAEATREVSSGRGKPASPLETVENDRHPSASFNRLLFWCFTMIGAVFCVYTASTLSAKLPLVPESQIEYRLPPPIFRAISFACLLLTGFCLSAMAVRHLEWRGLTSPQARIYLNGFLQSLIGGDMRRIYRVHQKQNRKRLGREDKRKD